MILRELSSGESLRKFRRNLAAGAVVKEDLLTTRFRLALPESSVLKPFNTFESYRRLYNVIEGCESGSLSYFLFSVILSGFRIFATPSEAEQFAARRCYDEEAFAAALTDALGAKLPGLTVSTLVKRLKAEVRTTARKSGIFCEETIESEYCRSLVGRFFPHDIDETLLENLFHDIAKEICLAGFSSWKSLSENVLGAVEAVDKALAGYGDFPSLAGMVSRARQTVDLPAGATIVFDNTKPMTAIESLGEYAPHAAVSVLLQDIAPVDGERLAGRIQNALTTPSASGLHWLFSQGLECFQTQSLERLCADFSVPIAEKARIEQIVRAARAIPSQKLFYKEALPLGYHDFRSAFAGRLDSWVSHYIERLTTLRKMVANEVGLGDRSLLASQALDRLFGGEVRNIVTDIAVVRGFLEEANRIVSLKKTGDQSDGSKDPKAQKVLGDWEAFFRLPALNRMSGGVLSGKETIHDLDALPSELLALQEMHFALLLSSLSTPVSAADVLSAAQRRFLSVSESTTDFKEAALREILEEVASTVRTSNAQSAEELKSWFRQQRIFADTAVFNRYFHSRQGRIFSFSPRSSRVRGLALSPDLLDRAEGVWSSFLDFVAVRKNRYKLGTIDWQTVRIWNSLVMTKTAAAVDGSVPHYLSVVRTSEKLARLVDEQVRLYDKRHAFRSFALESVFGAYQTLLQKLFAKLNADAFFLRTKFMWVGNRTIHYVPKGGLWHLPRERYARSPDWQAVFESGILVETSTGAVNVRETFARALKLWRSSSPDWLRVLFRQLPHDWCYALPIEREAGSLTARKKDIAVWESLSVRKHGVHGSLLKASRVDIAAMARLVGPSSLKGRLDAILLNPDMTVGDMTLMATQEYARVGGRFLPKKLHLELALPLRCPLEEKTPPGFKRIVAVDQGMYGLAYAVFDLTDAGNARAMPIASGTIGIASIEKLKKKFFRAGRPGNGGTDERYHSTYLGRANVVGDVCSAIAGLMQRYEAYPVLEFDVADLCKNKTGNAFVYDQVNARFLNDRSPTHMRARRAWWFGAAYWELPDYLQAVSCDGMANESVSRHRERVVINGKSFLPLRVYPGAGVPAKWTSRICSTCGRNVFEAIDKLLQKERESRVPIRIELDANGETMLDGETVRLLAAPTAQAEREARRRNERAQRTKPLADKEYSLTGFSKRVMENLRRPPRSVQTKDSRYSRYFCVYKDCPDHLRAKHADINAAVNIGRRHLEGLVKVDAFSLREEK